MNIKVRRAVFDDNIQIGELVASFRNEQNISYSKDTATETAKNMLKAYSDNKSNMVFVAEADDKILGYITVHWIYSVMIPGIEGYVTQLVISDKARGNGLGKKLMNIVERKADEKGAYRLILNCFKESECYKKDFYKKMSFSERLTHSNFVKVF
ncbi:MAG TPA: GNAT family N-acetyltransferase [Victivallales bacterium]|nr:GNAT family N-acetyltransferase [Victivallales bacterium]